MDNLFKIMIKSQFKAKLLLVLYTICTFINIIAEWFNFEQLILFSKPLLMFLLLIFFVLNISQNKKNAVIIWMIIAIITSNAGDILLLFTSRPSTGELFFLAGLSSFLLTHISYAIVFDQLTQKRKYSFPLKLILPLIIFWLVFNGAFSLNLSGILKPAVMVYSFVIMVMVYFAWRLKETLKTTTANWVWWGALLFLLSDTFIGLNKFGQDLFIIPNVRVLIMATYLAGQVLIVLGITALCRSILIK